MRRAFKRVAVASALTARSRQMKFPAPTRGWVTNENLANAKPGAAGILNNWFPTSTGARIRKGSLKVGQLPSAVVSMFDYNTSGVKRLFAATSTKIYDVFNGLAEAVTGQNSGYYSTIQFATVGGQFLVAVNGTDKLRLFNGATWASIDGITTPAITGPNTATLSNVWSYRNRLFFVQKNTMSAWFLPVDSIGGAAQEFSLGGIFKRGGSLLFGANWSLNDGTGIDEKCVFVSTQGEVAIYQGADPASATSWSIVGLYDITPSMGMKATMQAGGDLLIGTQVGIVPLSQAISADPAALSLASVSRNIETEWLSEVQKRLNQPWEIIKWPLQKMAIVALPMGGEALPYCFVVNLETGAWTKYTGWDVACGAIYLGRAYFGTSDGRIMQAETGASDDGSAYSCDYLGLYSDMGAATALKSVRVARATFRAGVPVAAQIDAGTDYASMLPAYGTVMQDNVASSTWDNGLWDVALWDGGTAKTISTRWLSIGKTGFAIAPSLRAVVSGGGEPDGEMISIEYMSEIGGTVV